MKRSVSLILAFLIVISVLFSLPSYAFALETTEEAAYFLPVVVEGAQAYQGEHQIDTVVRGGEVLLSTEDIESDALDGAYLTPAQLAAQVDGEVDRHGSVTAVVKPFQTRRLIVESESAAPRIAGSSVSQSSDGSYIYAFHSEDACERAYEQLRQNSAVQRVTGENVYSISDTTAQQKAGLSWGADYVHSQKAIRYAEEKSLSETVTVAVVDTGIDTDHPYLKDRISSKSTGFVGSGGAEDDNDHGTHCAGIVVANTSDNVRIMAVKGLDKDGRGTDINLAQSVRYAADNGADVISMSWGGYSFWTGSVLTDAVEYAYEKGCICVVAAGNDGIKADAEYPANSEHCITVAAVNSEGKPASFSNYGKCVDVAAPGVSINSTVVGGYGIHSGTSMATPFVSAFCAMDTLLGGSSSFAEKLNFVKTSTTDFGVDTENFGAGIICFDDLMKDAVTAPVVFSRAGGSCNSAFSLQLSCADASAKIYYTVTEKGGIPKQPSEKSGTLYTAPITVDRFVTVRAIACAAGKAASRVTQAVYRFEDASSLVTYHVNDDGYLTGYDGFLLELDVPEFVGGVRVIGVSDGACSGKNLYSIRLPDSVTAIGNRAFAGCSNLHAVYAPQCCAVGDSCFQNDGALVTVDMPRLISVGKSSFEGCTRLTEEKIDLSNLKTVPANAFSRTGITVLQSDNLIGIGSGAFSACPLVSVDLPAVQSIGDRAFYGCSSLESAKLPQSQSIGDSAFEQCEALFDLKAQQVQRIGNSAFYRCKSLSAVDFPQAAQLGSGAFAYCTKLAGVTLPELQTVPAKCFYHCAALTQVPDCAKNATAVEDEAFGYCNNLQSMEFSNALFFGVQTLNCAVTEFSLPLAEVVGGLKNNSTLQSVSLPRCTEISDDGFSNCSNLKTADTPSLMKLGKNAFSSCYALQSIDLRLVTEAGSNAFSDCRALTALYAPRLSTSQINTNYMNNLQWFYAPQLSALDKPVTLYQNLPDAGASAEPANVRFDVDAPHLCVLCGSELYENITFGETLLLPRGSECIVMCDSGVSALRVGDDTVNEGACGFVFTVTDDVTVSGAQSAVITAADVSVSDTDFAPGEESQMPPHSVTVNGTLLLEGRDYTTQFFHNRTAGTARYCVRGIGDYAGCAVGTFTVHPLSADDCTVADIPPCAYRGTAVTPDVTVRYHETDVTEYFEITFTDDTAPGSNAKAVATGKGAFSGTLEKNFTVCATPEILALALSETCMEYNGEAHQPTVLAFLDGKAIPQEGNLAVSYSDNTQVGTAHAHVTFCSADGVWCGETDLPFEIIEYVEPHVHDYVPTVIPPTCTKGGCTVYTCRCGESYTGDEVPARGHQRGAAKKENAVAATYTKAGSYDSVVYCTVCGRELSRKKVNVPKLTKKANPLFAKGKTVSVKYKALKKQAVSVDRKNAIKVTGAKGALSFSKTGGNKKITVSKNGRITVKKGLKKGTYKLTVRVTAAGTTAYKKATKTVTVTVHIK